MFEKKNKKTVTSVIILFILLLAVAGVFCWQKTQDNVVRFNKNLPSGVRIVKDLFRKEYLIVNNIDGYEFKLPERLKKPKEVKYYEERKGEIPGLFLKGTDGEIVGIGVYELKQDTSLESWITGWISQFSSFVWSTEQEKIGDFAVVKAKEKSHLAGLPTYFFKKNFKIYEISGTSGELIQEIIVNGKW